MTDCVELTGLLLAAGLGRRFGGNKLETPYQGKMLGLYAAETLFSVAHRTIAVCNGDSPALAAAFAALGLEIIENRVPEAGLGHSLALGAQAARDGTGAGLIVCLGDMPFVTTGHLKALVSAFEAEDRQAIICTASGSAHMPPAIFPHAAFQQLGALTGDIGARALLQRAIPVEAGQAMITDIDRPEDLPR
jgi:molybdenum cofactor cytidylyltransferase